MNTVVETINTAGRAFVDFALPMLIQSSVLILILLAMDAILRRRVRAVFRYWIWMLVLVKLVLPPSLGSPMSIGVWFGDTLEVPTTALFEPEPPEAIEPQATEPYPTISTILSPPDPEIVRPLTPPASPMPAEAKQPVTPETKVVVPPPVVTLDWRGLTLLVWSAVVVALTLLLVQRAFFVRGLLAQAQEAIGAMASELEDCRARLGLRRRIGLRLSPNATSPAVCGLLRPVILIPQSLAPRLQSHDLQAVLLHELAHIKRGDLWVNLVQTLFQIAYFYNPLLWLANAMIRRTREQAVDEAVLVAMGETARQYPETLVNIARLAFTRRPTLSLRLIGVVESKSALTARIKHILNRPLPKTAKLGAIGLLAVLVLAAVLLPMARAQQDRADEAFSRLAVLPNCGVWVSDIAGQDLPMFDLASEEIIMLPAVGNERELLVKTETKGKGDILYYFDKAKDAAKITFLRRAGLGGKPLSNEYEMVTITPTEIPFETTVATQSGGSFKLRIIRADEQACAIQFHPLTDSRPAFKAILTEGITAELLGVHEYSKEGKNWWRPDGSPLLGAPLPEKDASSLRPSRGQAAYEVAVRLNHGPDGGLAGVYIPSSRGSHSSGGLYGAKDDLCRAAGVFPKSQKNCSVRCLVMTGPWETTARVSAKALGSGSKTNAGVTFCAAGDDPNEGATITAFCDFPNRRCDIRAVTTDGRIVDATSNDSGGYGGRDRRSTMHFRGLALAEIEEFEFRTRPWTWIEFRNVSLWPGLHANVEVHDDLPENRVMPAKMVLPEADRRPVALDLLRCELIPLPATGPELQKMQQALRQMGRGDLLYDVDSGDRTLILLRDATSEQVQEDTGEPRIKGYLFNPQRLPATLTITTTEGRRYEVTILAADEKSCTLRYSPIPADRGAGEGVPVESRETHSEQDEGGTGIAETSDQSGGRPTFGPVMEREFSLHGDLWIDLDRNRVTDPSAWVIRANTVDAMLKWSRAEGIDAVAERKVNGLGCIDLVAISLSEQAWTQFSAEQLQEALSSRDPVAAVSEDDVPVVYLKGVDPLPTTYGFRTREGGIGILQNFGFDGRLGNGRIRFKLVQGTGAKEANGNVGIKSKEGRQAQGTVVLPDVDHEAVMLDLLRGELIPMPQQPGLLPRYVQRALRQMGKGDILYDVDSGDRTLIFLRDATSEPAGEETGEPSVTGHLIGQQLPETLIVTTAEGRRFEVTILSADDERCTLKYSPLPLDKDAGGGVLVEPGRAGDSSSPAAETAGLPHGMKVELVGLCQQVRAGAGWWDPQGRSIPAPSHLADIHVGTLSEEYGCSILARVSGGRNTSAVFKIPAGYVGGSTRMSPEGSVFLHLSKWPPKPFEGSEKIDIECGVAQGEWIDSGVEIENKPDAGPVTLPLQNGDVVVIDPLSDSRRMTGSSRGTVLSGLPSSADYEFKAEFTTMDGRVWQNWELTPVRARREKPDSFVLILENIRPTEVAKVRVHYRRFTPVVFKGVCLRPGRESPGGRVSGPDPEKAGGNAVLDPGTSEPLGQDPEHVNKGAGGGAPVEPGKSGDSFARVPEYGRPTGRGLEFRIAATRGNLDSAALEGYRRALVDGNSPPEADFAWFPVRTSLTGTPQAIVQEHAGQTYVLLRNQRPYVVLPSQDWGLENVYRTPDAVGNPAVGLTLNAKGAALLREITAAGVGQSLAIVVDGTVVSMPHIAWPLAGESALITGNFTEQEIDELVRALREPAATPDAAAGWQDIGKPIPADANDARTLAPGVVLDGIGQDVEGKMFVSILRKIGATGDMQYRFRVHRKDGRVLEPQYYLSLERDGGKLWEKFTFDAWYHDREFDHLRLQSRRAERGQSPEIPVARDEIAAAAATGERPSPAEDAPPGRYALSFDGRDDYLFVPDSESLRMPPSLTVEMWIKPQFPEGPYKHRPAWAVLARGAYTGTGRVQVQGFGIQMANFDPNENTVEFDRCQAGDRAINTAPTFMKLPPDWVHLSETFSNQEHTAAPGHPLVVGRFLIPTDDSLYGQIAEIRVWDFTKAGDIRRYEGNALTGAEPGLIACWTFEEGRGRIAHDLSPNANHARLGSSVEADDADPRWTSLNAADSGERQTARAEPRGQPEDTLKRLIDEASSGSLVMIAPGRYTTPIQIARPLVLRGESQEGCVIEVTADQPAILVNTGGKGDVTLENLTIRWQLATQNRVEQPLALHVKDTNAVIRNCRFVALGDSRRAPVAVQIDGRSKSTVENCRFSGFDYVVCYGPGTEGVVQDCVITDCGHQGVIAYAGATLTVQRCIITGSKFHAVRCTGGTLHVKDNLLIRNANRGIYLGNKTGRGTIANNLIVGNGTGISGFGRADYVIANNTIIDNRFAGIDMRDSCRLSIRNNVLAKNQRGLALFKEGTQNFNVVAANAFWANATEAEGLERPADSVTADPQFADPNHGDFSVRGPVQAAGHGLADPRIIQRLWEKYEQLQHERPAEPMPQAQVTAELGSRLPQFKETLRAGASEARYKVLTTILSSRMPEILDDSFVPALQAAGNDPDPKVRNEVARVAGYRWVWSAPQQDPNVIELMLKLSSDRDREVRYNAVYHGLSVVRDKSEPVVRRLVNLALADQEQNFYGRIVWGLNGPTRADRQLVERVLNTALDDAGTEPERAAVRRLYQDVLEQEAPPIRNVSTFLLRILVTRFSLAQFYLRNGKRV